MCGPDRAAYRWRFSSESSEKYLPVSIPASPHEVVSVDGGLVNVTIRRLAVDTEIHIFNLSRKVYPMGMTVKRVESFGSAQDERADLQ